MERRNTRRRTKIVATVGPATWDSEMIYDMIMAGANVFRINAAHNDIPTRERIIDLVRGAGIEADAHVALLQDLAGSKPRTGPLPNGEQIRLRRGEPVELIAGEQMLEQHCISIDDPDLVGNLSAEQRVLMSDGLIEVQVDQMRGEVAECTVVRGGYLRGRQGVTVPGALVPKRLLSQDEKRDIQFAAEADLEYLGVSFVTCASDIEMVRSELARYDGRCGIIAKIERPEALDDLDAIAQASDAIMVARGDLGVQLPPEVVPIEQKRIIQVSHRYGTPVITATQMLESMIYQSIPTRAEASDVANAVLDGTDAVMLSAETATGQFPLEAVAMMDRVVSTVEQRLTPNRNLDVEQPVTIASTIARAAYDIARRAPLVDLIAVFTRSGFSAREVARERPDVPVVALTNNAFVARQLALVWGVRTIVSPYADDTQSLVAQMCEKLRESAYAVDGEHVLFIGSLVFHDEPGHTDLLHLRQLHS